MPKHLERVREYLERPGAARADSALASTERRDQTELAAFHLDRGRRFFEREDDRSALTELQRAIYLSPYQAEAHLLLGRLHLRAGRTRDAIDALKISLWSEETPAAHVALGEAYLQAKDPDAARAEAERALELAPGSVGSDRAPGTGAERDSRVAAITSFGDRPQPKHHRTWGLSPAENM